MRIARDLGGLQSLFPPGINSLHDCPFPLFDAIRQALIFLGFEKHDEDDRPPRYIWQDGEKLTMWFEERQRIWDSKSGSADSPPIEDPVSNGWVA